MGRIATLLCWVLVLGACSHGNCQKQKMNEQSQAATPKTVGASVEGEVPVMEKSSALDRVKVYKADGSLQCGQGKKIPLDEMQKELKGIKVHSSVNKNDGMMRIQLCGSPTGNCNVYEIERKDLEAALKAGFKEWVNE
ncbi:MAG: hypothetical protein AAGB31_15300 [Bdellovibrio sp.]